MIRLFNADSLAAMRLMPDKAYDLAVVDPPYGIGKRLVSGGPTVGWCNMVKSNADKWDVPPPPEYFEQLFRVSREQIIWGGNFFEIPPTKKPLCWDKVRPNQKNASEWEYAWTSFEGRAEMFRYCNNAGFIIPEPRIHPTQKPVRLYEWLLKNYAKPGDKILDTHGGSGSICIACDIMGFDLDFYEIDREYFTAAAERLARHQQQGKLFDGDTRPSISGRPQHGMDGKGIGDYQGGLSL